MAHSFGLFTLDDRASLDRPLIGFIRVSTTRQGEIGASQETQIAAINVFARIHGVQPVAIYGDVGTGVGKRAHEVNQELQDAVKHAKKFGGILVVSTANRVGRDLAVVDWLDIVGIDVAAADVGRLLTRKELRRAIASAASAVTKRRSQIKTGLSKAKARGVKLGNPEIERAQPRAVLGSIVKKDTLTEQVALILKKHDPNASLKRKDVADLLNRHGLRTGHKLLWNEHRVRRHLTTARTMVLDGDI